MKILPILVSIFIVIVITRLIKQARNNKLSNFSLLAWLVLWLAILLVFWQPEITSWLAFNLGVNRGADLVVYLSIIIIFYLLYRIFVHLNKIEEAITKVVREEAIKNVKDGRTR